MRHTSAAPGYPVEQERVHELALARSLVDQILEVVVREHLGCVTRVVLEIGAAAGVDADALRLGFEIATQGSPVEGAELAIDTLPGGRDLRVTALEF